MRLALRFDVASANRKQIKGLAGGRRAMGDHWAVEEIR